MKSSREMNWAVMVKMAWRLLKNRGEIWGEVIRAKYGIKDTNGAYFKSRKRASHIWKGVVWGAELLRKGLRWKVRDRRKVNFWKGVWLEQTPLRDGAQHQLSKEQFERKVRDY